MPILQNLLILLFNNLQQCGQDERLSWLLLNTFLKELTLLCFTQIPHNFTYFLSINHLPS